MTDDEEYSSVYDSSFEEFEEQYLMEHMEEEGLNRYDPDGAELGEGIFKSNHYDTPETEVDADMGWVVEGFTLRRIYNDIVEVIDEMEGKTEWEKKVRLMVADDMVLFYTLANEVLQGISSEILNRRLVVEERRSEELEESLNNISQVNQEELLFKSGLIDSGLKGELTRIRKMRNKVVHDLRQRHYLREVDNIESSLERSLKTIDALHESSRGYPLFDIEF